MNRLSTPEQVYDTRFKTLLAIFEMGDSGNVVHPADSAASVFRVKLELICVLWL